VGENIEGKIFVIEAPAIRFDIRKKDRWESVV
jgi:hypothetical protein